MKDYYEILEVSPKASKEIIERAYHVLVKQYHPDLYTGEERMYAESKIRDVNEAYKILSDSFLREQYDNEIIREKEEYSGKINKNNNQDRKRNINANSSIREEKRETKVGTFGSMVNVAKSVFKPRKLKNVKYEREDFMALGITIAIVIILGLILWFVPATNQLLRKAFPLFN